MAGGLGFFGGVGMLFFVGFGIECGGMVIVSVAGVDVVFFEFGIGEKGIGDVGGHDGSQVVVDAGEVGSATGTGEGFEEVIGGDEGASLVGMVLEKSVSAGGFGEATMDAEAGVVEIADDGTVVRLETVEVGGFEGSEEGLGELGLWCL